MKKIRILYCETNRDGTIGGSFYSLLFLIKGLDKSIYDPSVIFYKENSLINEYKNAGAKVHVLELPQSFHLMSYAWFSLLNKLSHGLLYILLSPVQKLINLNRFFIARSLKNWKFIRKNKYDLVHLNNTVNWNHDWMLAAKMAGIKCITHERGINPTFRPFTKTLGDIIDGIVCISESVKTNLLKQNFNPDKLYLIYNGLDPNEIQIKTPAELMRKKYGLDSSSLVIGMVGNFKAWKGQETVVRAVAALRDRFPAIKCLLVGDASEDNCKFIAMLKDIIRENNISENVIFTGYQKNVADYVNIMQIVIHASIDPEPFGRVLIEAMAMKKPLIGSDAGAVPEIIQDNITGKLFAPGNPSELAECITYLLENEKVANDFGNRGYERLMSHFHIRNNIEKTQHLYNSLLS